MQRKDNHLITLSAREFRPQITGILDRLAQEDKALLYESQGRATFVLVRTPPIFSLPDKARLMQRAADHYYAAFGLHSNWLPSQPPPEIPLNDLRRKIGRVQQELNYALQPHLLTRYWDVVGIVAPIPASAGLEEIRLFASLMMAEAPEYA